MPIISFAASKGGAGKTTLCLLIASELAVRGVPVTVLCTDPQHSAHKWSLRAAAAGNLPSNLNVERIDTEAIFNERLETSADTDLVLIDVQGALNQYLTIALAAADVTVVPSRATYMDVVEAVAIFEFANRLKTANLRLVLNEVKAVDTRTVAFTEAVRLVHSKQIPVFNTMVTQRAVYAQFSIDAGSLDRLVIDPSKADQVAKARLNIGRLMAEILEQAGYQ
jgi:chromosome partitioning protein